MHVLVGETYGHPWSSRFSFSIGWVVRLEYSNFREARHCGARVERTQFTLGDANDSKALARQYFCSRPGARTGLLYPEARVRGSDRLEDGRLSLAHRRAQGPAGY